MKAFQSACALLCIVAAVRAEDFDASLTEVESEMDPRLFFVNFTSSLIQVNATILAYGLIAIAVLGAAAVALYYLFLESQNSSSSSYGSYGSQGSYGQYSQYARSSNQGYNLDGLKIVQWIAMLKDMYENFDYNDLDCQKRLICEVMKEPEYYGNVARKFKDGFKYASVFDYVSLPDDMRELLDEYMDANARADQQKECYEYFPCNYSVKDATKRSNIAGNNL